MSPNTVTRHCHLTLISTLDATVDFVVTKLVDQICWYDPTQIHLDSRDRVYQDQGHPTQPLTPLSPKPVGMIPLKYILYPAIEFQGHLGRFGATRLHVEVIE